MNVMLILFFSNAEVEDNIKKTCKRKGTILTSPYDPLQEEEEDMFQNDGEQQTVEQLVEEQVESTHLNAEQLSASQDSPS